MTTDTSALAIATAIASYETREAWLNGLMDEARPIFEATGFPIPINTRVSVGFPSDGARSRTIGQCFYPIASNDGHYEIFITPTTETDARIADIFVHELCHAAVHFATGETGHGKAFGKLARAMGLEGKLTATTAGAQWFALFSPIMMALGAMPYAGIKVGSRTKPKKETFLHPLRCTDCGWLAQISKSHVRPSHEMHCPLPDCEGELRYKGTPGQDETYPNANYDWQGEAE
jgi:predicted SprT family Zn-dependent metalloprotease